MDAHLSDIFDKRVVSIAAALRRRGVDLLDHRAPGAESHYVDVPETVDEFVEIDEDDIAALLQVRWSQEGLEEMAALAPEVGKLIRMFAELSRGDGEVEPSPFVYAMF